MVSQPNHGGWAAAQGSSTSSDRPAFFIPPVKEVIMNLFQDLSR